MTNNNCTVHGCDALRYAYVVAQSSQGDRHTYPFKYLLFFGVPVCEYVGVRMCVCRHAADVRGQPWVWFVRHYPPCVSGKFSHWPGTCWLGEAVWSPVYLPSAGLEAGAVHLIFSLGFLGLSSGLYAYKASQHFTDCAISLGPKYSLSLCDENI